MLWILLMQVSLLFGKWSRQVSWLVILRTNRDPKVVAASFLDYIRRIKGI